MPVVTKPPPTRRAVPALESLSVTEKVSNPGDASDGFPGIRYRGSLLPILLVQAALLVVERRSLGLGAAGVACRAGATLLIC